MQIQVRVEFQGIRRGKIENDSTLTELEMFCQIICGRMGDFERDNPNGNTYHLLTLCTRDESSMRDVCRERDSSSAVTSIPFGSVDLHRMWRYNKNEESKSVSTCKSVADKLVGKKTGKSNEKLKTILGGRQSRGCQSKTRYEPRKGLEQTSPFTQLRGLLFEMRIRMISEPIPATYVTASGKRHPQSRAETCCVSVASVANIHKIEIQVVMIKFPTETMTDTGCRSAVEGKSLRHVLQRTKDGP